MTRRDKFFKMIRREEEGYVPYEIWLTPTVLQKLQAVIGTEDFNSYWQVPLRWVYPEKPVKRDYTPYFQDMTDLKLSDWGTGHRASDFLHFTRLVSPMADFTKIEEFRNYPYPEPGDYDWEDLGRQIQELKDQDLVVFGAMATTIFELAWNLRGFMKFFEDLQDENGFAEYLMDRIMDMRVVFATKYAELGCDCLHLGDDVSTQRGMMMSPDLWRQHFKPRLKRVIEAGKAVNPDILIDYHGDGNISDIIPDLIEIGVEILNPIQPECMDPFEIKRLYGDRLSFRGCIGTQTTMPYGTPEDVDRVCKELIEKVGKGGGLILSPSHMLEPEVPLENIFAYFEAIRKYSTR